MKTSHIIILLFIVLSSCTYRPFPPERYEIGENYRNLIDMYSVGDTLIFKSSQNIIDSFVISGIDSSIHDCKGYFINARNYKGISVTYKQIPIDKWQRRWTEMGSNNQERKERSCDATLIWLVKFPDEETAEYDFNFKEFYSSNKDIPTLRTDTIEMNGYKFTNYYKIENDDIDAEDSTSIQVCYSSIDKGLVAFKTYDNIYWTRQN